MKKSTHLRLLRKRLARLRRRRQRFRWATAASAVAIALLWALAGLFALDWCFQRNIDLVQRLLLIGLAAGGVAWAFARFARPWLGRREDDTDIALMVQRHAGIDSDLIAALQFESDAAAGWGSTQLETAVIDRMAIRQRDLDVMAAMPRQPLAGRMKLLAASAAVWLALGLIAPEYVAIFFQRLAFGAQHYPSRTLLVAVAVNGRNVDLAAPGAAVHVPCGQKIRFEATVAGSQPEAGSIEISNEAGGAAGSLPLKLLPGEGEETQARYRGEHAGLNQSARFQVYLGDAWTDPYTLSVTPLPAVEIAAEVVPPVYARQSAKELQKLPRGRRQFAVLAGSEVRLTLFSDRPLKDVEITIAEKKAEKKFAMRRGETAAQGEEVWSLAAAGTPLAAVAKDIAFSIQAHDDEGQTLEHPLEGAITIEPDQAPAITARTKSPLVLPSASPNIHYEAADDHALGRIWLTWEATAGDDSSPEVRQAFQPDHSANDAPAPDKRQGQVEIARFPPEAAPRNRAADYPFALESLPLKPGDTLKVTLHASDYRGPAAVVTADADPPLVFRVTDLHGFEASMNEADLKAAGGLEELRKKHTGLGDAK